jgi:hypothetical protein
MTLSYPPPQTMTDAQIHAALTADAEKANSCHSMVVPRARVSLSIACPFRYRASGLLSHKLTAAAINASWGNQ